MEWKSYPGRDMQRDGCVGALLCVHIELAARADRILAKPGMGFGRGILDSQKRDEPHDRADEGEK